MVSGNKRDVSELSHLPHREQVEAVIAMIGQNVASLADVMLHCDAGLNCKVETLAKLDAISAILRGLDVELQHWQL